MIARIATAGLVLALVADVMPHCGGRTTELQGPGQECGSHGSRWTGICRAPTACYVIDGSRGRICSIECKDDASCASLGADFKCTTTAKPDVNESASPVRICSR